MANPKWGTKAWGTTAWAVPDTTAESQSSTIYTPDGFSYNINDEVGKLYSAAINGFGLMLRSMLGMNYSKESQPTFVEKQNSGERGEDDFGYFWNQTFTDFIKGEGQKRYTRDGFLTKFWRSQGIDIATKGEFSLLYGTSQVKALNAAVVPLCVASTAAGVPYIYTATTTNAQVTYSADGVTWATAVATGAPAAVFVDFESDGNSIFGVIDLAGGVVYKGAVGTTADWTAATLTLANIKLKKVTIGRVSTASKAYTISHNTSTDVYGIYSFATSGAAATPDLISNSETTAGWIIEDLTFGDGSVYWVQHNQADKAWIMKNDGTSTTLHEVLPPGFIPKTIEYGLDGLYIGGSYNESSTKGEGRVYVVASGTTSLVTKVDNSVASTRKFDVNALLIRDDDLYLGHNHLTGIDKYDLSEAALSKNVYTSLSASDNNVVQKIVWFLNKPYFAVKNAGVYGQAATYQATGTMETSIFDYSTTARKYIALCEIEHKALTAGQSIEVQKSKDDGVTYESIFTNNNLGSTQTKITFKGENANTYALKVIITAGASNTTTPVVKSIKTLAAPYTEGKWLWQLPVLLNYGQTLMDGKSPNNYSPYEIKNALEAIKDSNTVIAFQDIDYLDSNAAHYVIIEDIKTVFTNLTDGKQEGICYVTAREVRV